MLRVVLDANVIISAILFGGKPEEIIKLALEEKIIILLSPDIITETLFVLRSKFRWSNDQARNVYLLLNDIAVLIMPAKRLAVIKEDDNDNRILECALEGRADCIVSGDKKHLLPLKAYSGISIISAARFQAQLNL